MYNEEQKMRYIREAELYYTPDFMANLYSLFKKTEPIEILFGKDVSVFTREDIGNMYSFFGYADVYTYSNTNSRLAGYCDWCLKQLLVADGCNHYKEFVVSDFAKYINVSLEKKKYLTQEEMYSFVDGMMNPRDKFVVLSIYEYGKSANYVDTLGVKLEDIRETESGYVMDLPTGRTVRVSEKLVSIAREANVQEKYVMVVTGGEKRLLPSEFIVKKASPSREMTGEDKKYGNKLVARIIKSLVDLYGEYNEINAATIATSGQFHLIREGAKRLGITPHEFINKHFDEVKAQYRPSPDNPTIYWKKYRNYI